jgi:MoxR-like ATPase
VPGVGKTTLAHALAQSLGLSWQRMQFTSDLLPRTSSASRSSIAHRSSSSSAPGRCSRSCCWPMRSTAQPRTQSALLEAMEERQVSADGKPIRCPSRSSSSPRRIRTSSSAPSLPESQLDRFLMRIELGYPDAALERQLLKGRDRRDLLSAIGSAISPQQLLMLQTKAPGVHASDALLDYVQAIVKFTRESPLFSAGLSPRAAIGLLRAAQAWALMHGHNGVLPEDVQAVLPGVAAHRLDSRGNGSGRSGGRDVVQELLRAVPVPD